MSMLNYFYIIILLLIPLSSCHYNSSDSDTYDESKISQGKSLVNESRCSFCHTPYVEEGEDEFDKYLSGHPEDYNFPDLPMVPKGSQQWFEFVENLENTIWLNSNAIVFSANITPDKETGIGTWTEKMFISAIRTGMHPKTKKNLNEPMPWTEYSSLTDDQLASIYAYLRTIKPVRNKVPNPIKLSN